MKMKHTMVAAGALAALAVGSAQAAVSYANTGNSSLIFVATDTNTGIQFAADLGLSFSDLLQNSAFIASRTSVSWNFATDTSSLATITGNEWSTAYDTFKTTQTGNDFKWAVIAGDSINGGTYAGRSLMATGNVTVAQMLAANSSNPTGVGLGNLNQFMAASANLPGSTMASANNGASVNTGSDVVTGIGAIGGTFGGGALTWNYLMDNGAISTFQHQQQTVSNPLVFQIGKLAGSATDTLNPDPITFQFDIATNSLVLAVPEPGTYALMLAGVAGLSLLARRRRG